VAVIHTATLKNCKRKRKGLKMPHNKFKENLRAVKNILQMVKLSPKEKDFLNLHLTKMHECFNDFIEESKSPLVKVVEENTAALNRFLEKLDGKSEGENADNMER